MASCKRRRQNTCPTLETPTLPVDLILEIVARSDTGTLFRFAATCKLLRRDILFPSFIRRVSHQAAPCILAYLHTNGGHEPPTLVHPSTAAAASFCRDHLWRSMSRKAETLLEKYKPVASRRGLVLLLRRNLKNRPKSQRCSDMCVYDPVSGACTFLSRPDIPRNKDFGHEHVLLTAADGIDCSFLLLVADFYGRSIKVQTASSCGTWGPITSVKEDEFWWCSVRRYCDPAVLHGGGIHWLSCDNKQIRNYNLGTGKTGSMKLPPTNNEVSQLHLATSSDGELLKLVGMEGFMISVWLQLPVSSAGGGGGWALEAVTDIEDKLRLMVPELPRGNPDVRIVLKGSGKRTGDVVFLRIDRPIYFDFIIVLDLETMDMHRQEWDGQLLEIDLPSRLENMKNIFLANLAMKIGHPAYKCYHLVLGMSTRCLNTF